MDVLSSPLNIGAATYLNEKLLYSTMDRDDAQNWGIDLVCRGGRMAWRFPVPGPDGEPTTHMLLDFMNDSLTFDGDARPDLPYSLHFVAPNTPLFIVSTIRDAWSLASIGICAISYLSRDALLPAIALSHVVACRPAGVLVLENERQPLAGGALATIQECRRLGVRAGGLVMPASGFPDGRTVRDIVSGAKKDADAVMTMLRGFDRLGADRPAEEFTLRMVA